VLLSENELGISNTKHQGKTKPNTNPRNMLMHVSLKEPSRAENKLYLKTLGLKGKLVDSYQFPIKGFL